MLLGPSWPATWGHGGGAHKRSARVSPRRPSTRSTSRPKTLSLNDAHHARLRRWAVRSCAAANERGRAGERSLTAWIPRRPAAAPSLSRRRTTAPRRRGRVPSRRRTRCRRRRQAPDGSLGSRARRDQIAKYASAPLFREFARARADNPSASPWPDGKSGNGNGRRRGRVGRITRPIRPTCCLWVWGHGDAAWLPPTDATCGFDCQETCLSDQPTPSEVGVTSISTRQPRQPAQYHPRPGNNSGGRVRRLHVRITARRHRHSFYRREAPLGTSRPASTAPMVHVPQRGDGRHSGGGGTEYRCRAAHRPGRADRGPDAAIFFAGRGNRSAADKNSTGHHQPGRALAGLRPIHRPGRQARYGQREGRQPHKHFLIYIFFNLPQIFSSVLGGTAADTPAPGRHHDPLRSTQAFRWAGSAVGSAVRRGPLVATT